MCTIFNKPIIDVEATASNIKTHRIKAGFTVKQIQTIFNFNSPQDCEVFSVNSVGLR